MPFYTYILKSLKDDGYYYGHTADIDNRLSIHNGKKVRSTKARTPFVIHYFETFETRSDAYLQEMYFKSVAVYHKRSHDYTSTEIVSCYSMLRKIIFHSSIPAIHHHPALQNSLMRDTDIHPFGINQPEQDLSRFFRLLIWKLFH